MTGYTIGGTAVLSTLGAGTGAGVLADLSLDGTISAGERGGGTVPRGGAVGAEVRVGMIPGLVRQGEWKYVAKGQTGIVEKDMGSRA